jgi:hypothetical protein
MPTVPRSAPRVDTSIGLPDAPLTVPTGRSTVAAPAAPAPIDIPDDILEQRPRRPSSFFGIGGTRGAVDPSTIAPRLPTPLSETLETSFDLATDQHALAIQDALKEEYEAYAAELEEQTGQRPSFNPYSSTTRTVRDRRASLTNAGQAPATSLEDDTLAAWHDEVSSIRARHPDAPLRSHDDLVGRVTEARKQTREARARAEAGEQGFVSGAAAVAGGIAGGATDPLLLTTLPFGSPWSAGVLRFALTEAAIGAGTEAVGQAVLQPSRAIVGEEPSLGEAAANVAAAGVGAGILDGAIRGAGKGIAALRSRRARIEAVEQALADGRITRTNDLDAALAVEKRTLDIEDANPLGRDVSGVTTHSGRFDAAQRAINTNGEVSHSVPREGLVVLPAADRQAVSELLDLANTEPARFAEVVEAIRQAPQEGAETLAQFVRREGGILDRDPAAEAAGLTVEMLPGLVGRGGRPIDDVAAAAAKAGYFPAGTPTRADLVAALTDELHQGRPVTRAGAEAVPPATAALARQASALDRLGIDVRTLAPTEAAARLRAIASTPAAGPQRGVAAGATRAPAESSRLAEGRADGQRAVTAEEQAVELDEVREQTVRDLYAGKEDTRISIEQEDGSVQTMSIREMFDAIEREADEAEALNVCIAGGARKGAAAGGAGIIDAAANLARRVFPGL